MKNAQIIWRIILSKNQGLSYNFILGRLPHAENEWFVDASSNFGCGGVCGYRYFMVDNSQIIRSKFLGQKIKFEDVSIAYRELLSVVIAFTYFSSLSPSSLIRINADNQNVIAWLKKGRCSKKLGYRLLSVIELMKLKYNLKISAKYIKSSANTSADMLFRGKTPKWLKHRGIKCDVIMQKIEKIFENPVMFWKKALLR